MHFNSCQITPIFYQIDKLLIWKCRITVFTEQLRHQRETNLESHSMVVSGLNIQPHMSVFTVRVQKAHTKDDWMDLEQIICLLYLFTLVMLKKSNLSNCFVWEVGFSAYTAVSEASFEVIFWGSFVSMLQNLKKQFQWIGWYLQQHLQQGHISVLKL